MKTKKKSARPSAARVRPPKPGQGNPHWGRAYVMETRQHNWRPEKGETRRTPPISLSAAPGLEHNRTKVSLEESVMNENVMWNGRPARPMLNLSIEFRVPMRPGGVAKMDREPMSVSQALSFEEAVRAVFRAAREKGILPPVHHDEL